MRWLTYFSVKFLYSAKTLSHQSASLGGNGELSMEASQFYKHNLCYSTVIWMWSVLVSLLNHNVDRFRLTQIKVYFKPFSAAKSNVVFAPGLLRENFLSLVIVLFIYLLWEDWIRYIWGFFLFVCSRLLTFFKFVLKLSEPTGNCWCFEALT